MLFCFLIFVLKFLIFDRCSLRRRGRRLAWNCLWHVTCKTFGVAMYHSYFSASSSLFYFFSSSLLRRRFGEGKKYEKNSKLPSLRQNIIVRPLGDPEVQRVQIGQVPKVWKYKELERWKTPGTIWSNSAIFLQRMRFKVLTHLASQTSLIFCGAYRRFPR